MADATSPRRLFETRLAELVEKFDRHRAAYLRADYPESQTRIDFIDPLFEALGWDVRNEAGLGPAGREVVVEQGDTAGRPDYNFRLDGRTVFFVEAKAPHVPLERADVVMQAKQYAWNSKDVFVAAVTDFEEFRLYDATVKPDRKHPDVGLIFAHRYGDYLKPKALDDLWLLSKESVAAGSIDQLLKMSSVKQRQRMPVDEAFLDDLSGWREQLAKAVYKTHPDLAVADLNSVVQVFLDRLVFIRIAEDRGILKPRGLEDIARLWEHSGKRRSIVADLNALFHEVNALLNGEIFKPHPCEKIDWDASADLVVKIVRGLYDGPYKFDYIGVELLGSIYERYLGKTIRVTATRAIVEDKPEVRKAGGVYYTPKYIVDYIVDQTVGRLIEGKTPAQIAKLRILDPACGSGSFLLGAYQKLLDYHQRYKAERRAKKRKAPAQPELIGAGDSGEVKLSLEEKAAILRNNLYGVDIDPQAVEITMMSLYIKMLDGERGLIAGRGVLPPLKDNIKCGNSLIGHDIREMEGITEDDLERINPFDWQSKREGFGTIMEAGRFDAVIGNPPYVKEYVNRQPFHDLRGTRLAKYYQGKMDIWYIFTCLAIDLLKPGGLHSFIATNNWITNSGASILRQKVLAETKLHEFTDFGDYKVFETASIQTMIYLIEKTGKAHRGSVRYRRITNASISLDEAMRFLTGNELGNFALSFQASITADSKGHVFTFVNDKESRVLQHIKAVGRYRLKAQDVAQGIVLPQDFVLSKHLPYLRDSRLKPGYGIFVISDREKKSLQLSDAEIRIIKPYYTTRELQRYYGNPRHELWVIYTDAAAVANMREYPNIRTHLDRFAQIITSDNRPYGLHRARDEQFFVGEKIVSLRKTDRPHFTYADFPCYVSQTFFVIKPTDVNLKYLIGILNSQTSYFWLSRRGKKQGESLQIDKEPLLEIPIRSVDFNNPADKARHDKMVSLVQRMLDLHKQKQSATSEAARARLEREINITDEQIDKLVYELYGLTDEEIRIVEGVGE